MFITKVFSFFFVCLLAACGNSVSQTANTNQTYINKTIADSVKTTQKENNTYLIKMSRSGCLGSCPAYNLTVYEDGKVIFEGIKFTKIEGKEETYLNSK